MGPQVEFEFDLEMNYYKYCIYNIIGEDYRRPSCYLFIFENKRTLLLVSTRTGHIFLFFCRRRRKKKKPGCPGGFAEDAPYYNFKKNYYSISLGYYVRTRRWENQKYYLHHHAPFRVVRVRHLSSFPAAKYYPKIKWSKILYTPQLWNAPLYFKKKKTQLLGKFCSNKIQKLFKI